MKAELQGVVLSIERERAASEKSFYEIERDFESEAGKLQYPGVDVGEPDLDLDWYWCLSKRHKALFLLDCAAKVHDLAKRLLEAAAKEERELAS